MKMNINGVMDAEAILVIIVMRLQIRESDFDIQMVWNWRPPEHRVS